MRQLEDFEIDEIEDTLRLCSNVFNSPKRETCLDRMIMLCQNWIWDAKHDVPRDETTKNGVMYRMRVGQVPGDSNGRYENGRKIKRREDGICFSTETDEILSDVELDDRYKDIQDWFNSLTIEERLSFAERYPDQVKTKEK